MTKKGKRKVQGVPQSQTAALPRPQEEEETDKSKQAQTEQVTAIVKQCKGLNSDLKPELKKSTNSTIMGPTTGIGS